MLTIWFDHPMKRRVTGIKSDKITKMFIDLGFTDSWLGQFLSDVRIYHSNWESDHKFLVTKLITPANKIVRFHLRK